MKSRWTWIKEKYTAARAKISETTQKTTSVLQAIYELSKISYQFVSKVLTAFFSRAAVKKYLFSSAKQGWVGFTRILHFTSTTVMFDKPQTRQILARSSKINSVKLGYIIARAVTLDALIKNISESDSGYKSYALFPLYSMSNILQVFSYSQNAKLLYANMLLNVSASTILTKENPDVINHYYKPCGDDAGAILSAGFESFKEYYFIMGFLEAASYVPGLFFACLVARIYINGRSMTELKLAAVGTCAEHRINILKGLNAFSFGMGLSFEGVTYVACYLIERLTGIPTAETRTTVQQILFPYFSAAVVLMKEPIPPFDENPKAKPTGRDLMWLPREFQKLVIKVARWTLGIKTEEEKKAEEEARKKEEEEDGKKKEQEEQATKKAEGKPKSEKKKKDQENKARKDSEAKPLAAVEPIAAANANDVVLKPQPEEINKMRLKDWLEYGQAARLNINEKTTKYPFFAALKYMVTFDLCNDWSSLEAFLSNHENKIFFSTYYAVTLQQLVGIRELRDKPFKNQTWAEALKGAAARIIPGLPNWLSRFLVSDDYKAMLAFILSDGVKDPLDDIIKMLKEGYEIHRLAIEREEQEKANAIKIADPAALVSATQTEEKKQAFGKAENVNFEGLKGAIASSMFDPPAVKPPRRMTVGEANIVLHDDYQPAAAANGSSSNLKTSDDDGGVMTQRDHVSARELQTKGFLARHPSPPESSVDCDANNTPVNDADSVYQSTLGFNQSA